jgi:predicted SAM-dependent methyltransferase
MIFPGHGNPPGKHRNAIVDGTRLHIGGSQACPGWTVFDINPAAHVDEVGDVRDLSRFASQSCSDIYASHVLEHLGYQTEIAHVLSEFHRILKPGGMVRISVPDLETLCELFLEPLPPAEKFELMRMMFGGQMDAYDQHRTGLSFQILGDFLHEAGFVNIARVPSFGLFDDASEMRFHNIPISCNMQAIRPDAA